jgi:TatD DNase family protein
MNFPKTGDFIDIHTHGGKPAPGIFIVESLMAHESVTPKNVPGVAFTYGIHPWFLTKENASQLLDSVRESVKSTEVIAIGEAGFDRLQGPSPEIQRSVFEEQVKLADEHHKPLIIHCVKAWEELLAVKKNLNPQTPWLIHGFRGTPELATQLFLKGMYLSLWFDFALRPESSKLLKTIPKSRFFLETDGSDVDIRTIYNKVAGDMDIEVDELKVIMLSNYNEFFNK